MDDFIAPHATRIAIWDVYLLPVGLDIFGAQPDQLRQVVVEGRNAFEANQHADVLRVVRKGFPSTLSRPGRHRPS